MLAPLVADKQLLLRFIPNEYYIRNNPYFKLNYIGSTYSIVGDVFKCGYSANNSGILTMPIQTSPTFTLRIIMKVNSIKTTSDRLIETTKNTTITLSNSGNTIQPSNGGTAYVNGAASSGVLIGQYAEYVVTSTRNSKGDFIKSLFCALNKANNLDADIKLLEIYKGVLTPSQISNLYNNLRYKKLILPSNEILSIYRNGDRTVDKYNSIVSINNVKQLNNRLAFTNTSGCSIVTNVPIPDEYSISMWVNPLYNSKNLKVISSVASIYNIRVEATTRVIQFSAISQVASSSIAIQTGKLQHIIIRFKRLPSSYIIGFSINGSVVPNVTKSETVTITGNFIIGTDASNVQSHLLKHIRIFNRLLTDNECSQIYTSEKQIVEVM